MPDLQQRIADLMRTHRFERHSESRDGYFAWWGHCTGCAFESDRRNSNYVGWELDMRDDEARHVAEVLVSELGITAEWALTSGGGRQKTMSERSAREKAKRWPEAFGVASRYVTRWADQ